MDGVEHSENENPSGNPDVAVLAARERLKKSDAFKECKGEIEIEQKNRTLILRGRVPSYYVKQILQSTLFGIDGVDQIDNRIVVEWPNSSQ